jgi:type I restriction enzyme M protein
VNRRNRELSDDDIAEIAQTYHKWRIRPAEYKDILGFCKTARLEQVRARNYVLTPGRYIGLADDEDDFNFAQRFTELKTELEKQIAQESELTRRIQENLAKINLSTNDNDSE